MRQLTKKIASDAIHAYIFYDAETDTERAQERAIDYIASDEYNGDFPIVVCLCGSTRFYEAFQRANYDETMDGRIVLSVGFYPHSAEQAHGEAVGCTPAQKEALDALHMHKIDMADEILVLNIGGYIGESTAREIAHAERNGKRVRYLEEPHD